MGPRNGVPATLASRGAPRGDDKDLFYSFAVRTMPQRAAPCFDRLRRTRFCPRVHVLILTLSELARYGIARVSHSSRFHDLLQPVQV